MLPFFSELITQTDEARRGFETDQAIVDAVANGMPLARYRQLLLELYHLVWNFNPICAAAASRLQDDQRDVRYFLYEHMHEEAGHEAWVANDLEAIGTTATDLQGYRPSPDTLALVGYNYWNADRGDPVSVLGMMYVLEVIASVYGGPFSSAISESLLLEGDRGVSFIRSHATMDTQHMAELRQVLNRLQQADARESVLSSTVVNFHLVTKIFGAL
jgi:pyrroloquinoline quinone (PQQ) biosynthesis protein C